MKYLSVALLILSLSHSVYAGGEPATAATVNRRTFLISACATALAGRFTSAAMASAPVKVRWEIIGQKSAAPVHRGEFEMDRRKSAGDATIALLEKSKIPYVGNESGINSILGTATGDAAIVVVNDHTMRVYGWCYEVDGKQPDVRPDKFFFEGSSANLRWFYAYSLYEKGEWKTFCTPAHRLPWTVK